MIVAGFRDRRNRSERTAIPECQGGRFDMKVYISLPITGHDIEEVEARCIFAKAVLKKKGHTPVSPLDISDNPYASYAEHMGRDISALLECDAVVFLDGWRESKGCTLEHAAAKIYNKLITYEL